ncbi:MAG: hypothetical protein Kow0010_02500 [Dehalococcoidia bacterium]
MTLALSGKSRRRQGLLGLLAVLAVTLAVTAGSAINNGGTAEAAPVAFFTETFNGDGNSIPGWDESPDGDGGKDCKLQSNHAHLEEGCAITRTISTSGYQNISLEFICHGDSNAESNEDWLQVFADLNGDGDFNDASENLGTWSIVGSGAACPKSGNWSSVQSVNLSALSAAVNDNSNFHLQFKGVTDQGDEEIGLDDVKLLGEPIPQEITIIAHKIVCNSEADLPNRDGGADIVAGTAAALATGNCQLASGWTFEWAYDSQQSKPLDGGLIGTANGTFGTWNAFGPTDGSGQASATVPYNNGEKIWVREQLQAGYLGFSGHTTPAPGTSGNVSAEMWCHTDVLNYDNYDFIAGHNAGQTVYCVALNVEPKRDLTICKVVEGYPDDGVIDGQGFTWQFDVREAGGGNIHTGVGVTGYEGQTSENCTTVQVPQGKNIEVVESTSRPSNWNGDDSGYPKYDIGGSPSPPASGNTTTVIQGGADPVTVTFYNRTQPRFRLTVCKVILDQGGQEVPFADWGTVGPFSFSVDVHKGNVKTGTVGDLVGTATFTPNSAGPCVTFPVAEAGHYSYLAETVAPSDKWEAPRYSDINLNPASACTYQSGSDECDGHFPISENNPGRTVNVYNQLKPHTITVCKIMKDPQGNFIDGSGQTYNFSVDVTGPDGFNQTAQFNTVLDGTYNLPGVGNVPADCVSWETNKTGDYYYTNESGVPAGWATPLFSEFDTIPQPGNTFCEWHGSPGTPDVNCDSHIPVDNGAKYHRTIVVQNQVLTGDLVIKKVIQGDGAADDQFSGTVTGQAPFNNLSVNSSVSYPGIPAGGYTVAEDDPGGVGDGYVLLGYAEATNGTCPDSPSSTDPLQVTVPGGGTATVCIYNALASTPTILKAAAGYDVDQDRASWTITVNNNVVNAIARTVTIFDEGERVESVSGGTCSGVTPGVTVIPAGGISCTVPAGGVLVVTVSRANESTAQACEPGTVNDTASVVDSQLGTLPGVNSADVTIPGDDNLCPSTVTVQKFFDNDESGTINAGDSLINGWGMSISCSNGFAADGLTGANGQGTVVFDIGIGPYPVTCTVTEGTVTLVATIIGPVLETTLNGPGNALVQFLNDPTDLPPPPPPGNEGPVPQQNPQIPQPQEPEPQEPEPTVEPTEEPTVEPTAEPTEPAIEPQEPSPTPAPPDAGSGLAPEESRGSGSLAMALAGLLSLTGAAGALALARRRG